MYDFQSAPKVPQSNPRESVVSPLDIREARPPELAQRPEFAVPNASPSHRNSAPTLVPF